MMTLNNNGVTTMESALPQCILSARILVWIDIHAPRAVHVFK